MRAATGVPWKRATGPGMRTSGPSHSTLRKNSRNSCCGFVATCATDSTSPKATWRSCAAMEQVARVLRLRRTTDRLHESGHVRDDAPRAAGRRARRPRRSPRRPSTGTAPATFGAGVIISHPDLGGHHHVRARPSAANPAAARSSDTAARRRTSTGRTAARSSCTRLRASRRRRAARARSRAPPARRPGRRWRR